MAMTGEVAYILAKKYASTQAGRPSKAEIDSSIQEYLNANPVYTGASAEEKAEIQKNTQDIAQILDQIATTQGGLESIQTVVNTVEERVGTTETTLETITTAVDTLTTNVENTNNSITDINTELAKHWKELEGHWKAIAKSDKDIVKLDADVTNLDTRMGNAETRINSLTTDISAKADKTWVEENYYNKTEVDEKLANLELGDIDIDPAIVTKVNKNTEDIAAINTAFSQHQTDYATSISIIATIQNNLATQEHNISVLQNDMQEAEDDIKEIQDKVKGLNGNSAFATEEYVNTQVANLIDSAPNTLDTLQELANALGNDENFATTVATQLGNKSDVGHTHSYNELTDAPDLTLKADLSYVDEALAKKSNKGHVHSDLVGRITALEEREEVPADYEEVKSQVQSNTDTISTLAAQSRVEELEALIESLTAEVTVLKKSVSDGKELVAKAITLKGVPTATDSTFEELAINIGKIEQKELTESQIEAIEEQLSAEITEEGNLVIEQPTETLNLNFERQDDDLIMEDNTTGLVDARINESGELEVEY